LNFKLPKPSKVSIQVFSVSGQLISTLLQQQKLPAGNHTFSFSNQIKYEGMLFFVLKTEHGTLVRKGIQQRN